MRGTIVAILLVIGVTVAVGAWWAAFAAPEEGAPALTRAADGSAVFDLGTAPRSAEATQDGRAFELPGPPRRFLVVARRDDRVAIGWSDRADAEPVDSVRLHLPNRHVEVYADRQVEGRVVVEIWRGHTPVDGRSTIVIACAH